MHVALLIRNDKEHVYQDRIHPVVEWISFIGMIVCLWVPIPVFCPITTNIWYRLMGFSYRYVFSIFIAVTILVSLSP